MYVYYIYTLLLFAPAGFFTNRTKVLHVFVCFSNVFFYKYMYHSEMILTWRQKTSNIIRSTERITELYLYRKLIVIIPQNCWSV